jgi:hypothetical protein
MARARLKQMHHHELPVKVDCDGQCPQPRPYIGSARVLDQHLLLDRRTSRRTAYDKGSRALALSSRCRLRVRCDRNRVAAAVPSKICSCGSSAAGPGRPESCSTRQALWPRGQMMATHASLTARPQGFPGTATPLAMPPRPVSWIGWLRRTPQWCRCISMAPRPAYLRRRPGSSTFHSATGRLLRRYCL